LFSINPFNYTLNSIRVVDGFAIIRWWLVYRAPDGNYYKVRDKGKFEFCSFELNMFGAIKKEI